VHHDKLIKQKEPEKPVQQKTELEPIKEEPIERPKSIAQRRQKRLPKPPPKPKPKPKAKPLSIAQRRSKRIPTVRK
jgi:hypothetical protein